VMKINQTLWSIQTLTQRKPEINLNPSWQRGPAWREPRQVLLIDSILRGMDIPKIYLRKLHPGGGHAYDAVDGQQRLRALWLFAEGRLALTHPEPLSPIDTLPVADQRFSDLPKSLRDRFNAFEVSVAEIVEADNNEITHLFSRLQMGVPLNPAELRNAMLVPMRHTIDTMATAHIFFTESRISASRYKRQDYAAHAFAMAAYGGIRDIKAPTLMAMNREFGPTQMIDILRFSREVGDALNVLANVNRVAAFRITQKWIFVDLCWLVMQHQAEGAVVDAAKLATAYLTFETLRRRNTSAPEELIRASRVPPLDRHLYSYIVAFRTEGAARQNLIIRNSALRAFCSDIEASKQ
jgi:hypothetical protein